MNHIFDTCPLTRLEGELNLLYEADDDAVIMAGIYSDCSTREIIIIVAVVSNKLITRHCGR